VAQTWAQEQPANPAAQAHVEWLGVLLRQGGSDLPEAALAALTNPGAAPEARAAGALLLLRDNRAEEARAALAPHESEFSTAPRAALAYGAVLAVSRHGGEAVHWLDLAGAARLLPPERALLQQAGALMPPAAQPSVRP